MNRDPFERDQHNQTTGHAVGRMGAILLAVFGVAARCGDDVARLGVRASSQFSRAATQANHATRRFEAANTHLLRLRHRTKASASQAITVDTLDRRIAHTIESSVECLVQSVTSEGSD